MPLYLDVHNKIEALTADGVAGAHAKDLEVQHKHGVKYLRYWFDEGTGKVSASARPRARKPPRPCTGKRTASWRTRSLRSRKGASDCGRQRPHPQGLC